MSEISKAEPVAWRYKLHATGDAWTVSAEKPQGSSIEPLFAAPVASPLVGEDAERPYPWKSIRQVPGTSIVNGSTMLLDVDGACIGLVTVLNADDSVRVDVARALDTAGDIAKTRRFIAAARHGEEEANVRAEAAEADLDTFRTFAHEATKAITGLTGGGSEYFGKEVDGVYLADLPRCVERLRYRLDRAALSAASIPTGVKSLAWETFEGRSYVQANCVLGQYQVSYLREFETWQMHRPAVAGTEWKENFSRHATRDEAKAAAQADYERRILSALVSPPPVGGQTDLPVAGDTDGPVPTHECEFCIGQAVHLASPYPEDDPSAVYYVTGITWEHRFVPHRGWNVAIATAEELSKGHGQTDGFSPSDLRAASRIVLHQITGNGPGVIGADNCQICGRWFNAPETDVCKNTPVDAHPAPERETRHD